MELGKRYEFTEQEGTISQAGINQITGLLRGQRIGSPDWQPLNPKSTILYAPALPDDWEWVWLVQSGEYRGTFPKRVAQYYFKVKGLKIPQSILTEIGNLARQHSSEAITYSFDFTNRFDWWDGQFGDRGSCYWGGRSGAREMLVDNGALAIRFFIPGTEQGFGRAWLVPMEPYHILFNGYGFTGNATLTISKIFASWRGETYRRFSLSNNHSSYGVLYINGNGTAYAIGTAEAISEVTSIELDWPEIHTSTCFRCEDPIDEDDAFIGLNDELYCEYCYGEEFARCDVCQNERWDDEITYIDYQAVCGRCRDQHYLSCEKCRREIHSDDSFHHSNGHDYCASCYAQMKKPVAK